MKDVATILGVTLEELKSATSEAAAVGATSLPVGLLVDFDPEGGSALLGDDPAVDTIVSYIGVDYDAYALLLEVPLVAAVDVDTPVKCLNTLGEVEREKKVLVDRGEDDDEDTIEATVDLRFDGHFPEGESLAGLWVEIESDGDEWRVVSTPFDAPPLDSAVITTPYLRAHRASDLVTNHNVLTAIATWVVSESTSMDPPASGWFPITESGIYLIVFSPSWQANSSGSRYSMIQTKDAAGVIATARQVAVPSSANITLGVQVSAALMLPSGWSVRMQVQQTSGADLNLVGSADGRLTGVEIVKVATA